MKLGSINVDQTSETPARPLHHLKIQPDISLTKFFERPILLNTLAWTSGGITAPNNNTIFAQ